MLAVVLAAGRGSRLGSLTVDRSKAMMPVVGKPMIGRVLEMLLRGSVRRVIVVAHPDDRRLRAYVGRTPWTGRILLIHQERRLGMADALEEAAPALRQEAVSEFVLASCDNLYPAGHVGRLVACRRADASDAALTLMWARWETARSSALVVLEDHWVTRIIEKPDPAHVSQGGHQRVLIAPSLYALSSRILEYLPLVRLSRRGEREIADALALLIAAGGRVSGELARGRMTLTTPDDLLALNRYYLRAESVGAVVEPRLPVGTTILAPVRIEREAMLEDGTTIGPETYLESGCRVGHGATVRRSVVMRGARVEPGALVSDSVLAPMGATG